MAQQDSRYGCRIQRSRHSGYSWLVIGACLRAAGIEAGSRDELIVFAWAADPTSPRPHKLYMRILRAFQASGIYERIKIAKWRQKCKGTRPMDADIIAGDKT